jgi:hypothetical protein
MGVAISATTRSAAATTVFCDNHFFSLCFFVILHSTLPTILQTTMSVIPTAKIHITRGQEDYRNCAACCLLVLLGSILAQN